MAYSREDAKTLLRVKEKRLSNKEKEKLKEAASQSSYEKLKNS